MLALDETIVALASAAGGAARAVVRLSGPAVAPCLANCYRPLPAGRSWQQAPAPASTPGEFHLGPELGEVSCQLLYWPTARSYTRQPSAEVHLPGSAPLAAAAVRTLCRAGARLAQPGEFTLRAVLAGRIDLVQAEAVLGVIDAVSERELDLALRQLAGGLSQPLNRLRETIWETLAHFEAGLDFVEEDISFLTRQGLQQVLVASRGELAEIAHRLRARSLPADEFRVVLVGLPNVGKSSLLNALCGHEAAIVAGTAGTTRDTVTRRMAWEGGGATLFDTAGVDLEAAALPANSSAIEALAQAAAARARHSAHLVVLCLDGSRPLTDWERAQLAAPSTSDRLVVFTKSDLPRQAGEIPGALPTSATTGQGLPELRRALAARGGGPWTAEPGVVAATAERCGESVRLADEALARTERLLPTHSGEELIALELREALDALGSVTGAVTADDVLGRIFSRFCIGK